MAAPLTLTLAKLAEHLGLALKGEDRAFTGLNTLEAATDTEVSFLANPRYLPLLGTTRACAVIVAPEFADKVPTALLSQAPYVDFARAGALFARNQGEGQGISPLASLDPTAKIAPDCTIYPHVFVGPRAQIGAGSVLFPGSYVGEDATLGPGCVLYPNAVVLAGVSLGRECTLYPGAVLGADGFGYMRTEGTVRKIPQIGTVSLGDRVDVGANSCVDKATLGTTSVGTDSKLDNLVQIGHNVQVGEQALIIAQVGIAGSTKVGDRVTLAGQAGIAGHLHIGNDATVGPQAGVAKDIPAGTTGGGSPFMESRTYMRTAVTLPKLPDMYRKLQQLEQDIASLKNALALCCEKEKH